MFDLIFERVAGIKKKFPAKISGFEIAIKFRILARIKKRKKVCLELIPLQDKN